MNDLISQATFGDITIPAHQALPPAGFSQVAFRPACPQLVPVLQANGLTAWTLPMPDGANLTLLELEPMDEARAHITLDSYGLCKVGGDMVPIIYSRQVPQQDVLAPTLAPTATVAAVASSAESAPAPASGSGNGLIGMVAGSLLLLVMAAGFVVLNRRQPKGTAPRPTPARRPDSQADRTSAVEDLLQ